MWNDLGTEGDLCALCEDNELKSRECVVVVPVLLRNPECQTSSFQCELRMKNSVDTNVQKSKF